MQAIRQIVEVKNGNLNMKLPKGFRDGKVEVIILSSEIPEFTGKSISGLRGKLKLTDTQYVDFQTEVTQSREEWEQNI